MYNSCIWSSYYNPYGGLHKCYPQIIHRINGNSIMKVPYRYHLCISFPNHPIFIGIPLYWDGTFIGIPHVFTIQLWGVPRRWTASAWPTARTTSPRPRPSKTRRGPSASSTTRRPTQASQGRAGEMDRYGGFMEIEWFWDRDHMR